MVVAAVLETVGIGLVGPFVALLAGANLRMPAAFSIEWSTFAIVVLAFFVTKNGFLAALSWAQFRFLYGRQVRLATSLLSSYLARPYERFLEQNSSTLVRKL